MRDNARRALAGAGAAMVLCVAASSAFAGHFSISNTTFRVTWASLEFT
jgi:hypothetical protein